MDHGMNEKRIRMQSNKREIDNSHQETRNMNEEHTRGTIINFLQVVVFVYLIVHVF